MRGPPDPGNARSRPRQEGGFGKTDRPWQAIDAAEDSRSRSRRQETFTLAFRSEPGVDGVRAVRALCKAALRRFGLRCIHMAETGSPELTDGDGRAP